MIFLIQEQLQEAGFTAQESIGQRVRLADHLPLKMLLIDDDPAVRSTKDFGVNENFRPCSSVIPPSELTDAMICPFNSSSEVTIALREYITRKKQIST